MAIRQRLPYWPRLRGTRMLSAAFWWWHGGCLSPCEPCVCLPSLEFMPMSERLTLPVLPLREVVLFPGVYAGRRRTPRDVARHRGGVEERLPPHFCRGAARERRYGHSRRAVHDRDDHQDQPDPARPGRRAAAAARRAQGYGPPLYG